MLYKYSCSKGLSPSCLEIENGLCVGFIQTDVCFRIGEGTWILPDCYCWLPPPQLIIKSILTKTEDSEQGMPCQGFLCHHGNGVESSGMISCLFKQYQSAFAYVCLLEARPKLKTQ